MSRRVGISEPGCVVADSTDSKDIPNFLLIERTSIPTVVRIE